MAILELHNVHLRIPIYDANALRLFRRRKPVGVGTVGSHDFISSGVLQVQALTDISFTLRDGDRLALIGHNGAGKTTLLRFMAGIYPCISGTKNIEGSVYIYGGTSTINPEATGYENIQLTMRLCGVPRSNYGKIKKDIEDFTELGEYLEMPTRIYSAGMNARLSFAIATMYTPEILLIDEGIGAGDAKFTDKVEERIKEFTGRARIIVFASHSEGLLQRMCNKGLVMEAGRASFLGGIDQAIHHYRHIISASKTAA